MRNDGTSGGDATSDEQLAARAARGSLEAFEELVARHERSVFNFLLRRGLRGGDVEDAVQESFLRAWRSVAQFRGRSRFKTWLLAVAVREAAKIERRRPRFVRLTSEKGEEGEPASRAEGPARIVQRRDEGAALWELVERELSREQSSALWLRYGEGLSAREVGRVLGRSTVGARVFLHRARRQLAAHLGETREPVVRGVAIKTITGRRAGGGL